MLIKKKWLLLLMFVPFSYAEREANRQEAVVFRADSPSSPSASPAPMVNYGQIFMEESRSAAYFPFGVSVLGGYEISSPYMSSYFYGGEISYGFHSLLRFGLEYAVYDSTISSTLRALSTELKLYGMNIAYPVLESTMYLNWHGSVFIGHLNLAGFSKLSMDFPVHLGAGVMNMEKGNRFFAVKWGTGPRVYITSQLGVQVLLSQTVSVGRTQFLYTHGSLNIIGKF